MDIKSTRTELRKRGVYVADGDPALDMAVVCEVALAEALKKAEASGQTQADRMTAAATQFRDAARAAAAEFVRNVVGQVAGEVQAAAQTVASAMLEQMQAASAEAERHARHARLMQYLAAGFAALTLLLFVDLVWLRWF